MDTLVFVGVLLLLLISLVWYNYEDFLHMVVFIFGPWTQLGNF